VPEEKARKAFEDVLKGKAMERYSREGDPCPVGDSGAI
jgi:hypothetical protein